MSDDLEPREKESLIDRVFAAFKQGAELNVSNDGKILPLLFLFFRKKGFLAIPIQGDFKTTALAAQSAVRRLAPDAVYSVIDSLDPEEVLVTVETPNLRRTEVARVSRGELGAFLSDWRVDPGRKSVLSGFYLHIN